MAVPFGICVGDGCIFELRSFQIEVLKYKSRIIYVWSTASYFTIPPAFHLYVLKIKHKRMPLQSGLIDTFTAFKNY
jgi:hypothetical protein